MVVATYIAVTVPAVVALALLCLYLLIRRSLPKLDGTLRATGLHSKVIITRDRSGVPCISASTRTDGYYAFGYVHAQDRLWQMEL